MCAAIEAVTGGLGFRVVGIVVSPWREDETGLDRYRAMNHSTVVNSAAGLLALS